MSSLCSDPAFSYYGDADSSSDEMEEGSGEGWRVGHTWHDKKSGKFISFQQRNRELEEEVKDLERVVLSGLVDSHG